jgi:hypothetical protein
VATDAAQDALHAAADTDPPRPSAARSPRTSWPRWRRLLTGTQVAVNRDATTVIVRVRGTVESVVPFLSFHIDETATGTVEQYQPHR